MRRRLVALGTAKGLLQVAGGAGLALAALFAADRLTLLPGAVRAAAAAAFVVFVVAFLYSRVAVVLLRPPDVTAAARALETADARLGGVMLSAAQLALARQTRSSAPSEEFVEMAVEKALALGGRTSPREAVPSGIIFRPLAYASLAAAFWAAAAGFFAADARTFWTRITNPMGAAAYPTRTRIMSVEAPSVLPKEARFTASAIVRGILPAEAVFHISPSEGREERIYATGAGGRYQCALERVGASFTFYVEAGDARSADFAVEVVERPAVASLAANVTYPSYTAVGTTTVSGGNVAALAGSRVALTAEFNRPVSSAALVFSKLGKLPGLLSAGGTSACFDFEIVADDDYSVALVDQFGFDNPGAPIYRVTARPDAAPAVVLSRPSRDLTVVPAAVIPLEVSATDDYGVTALALSYSVRRAGVVAAEGDVALAAPQESARSARAVCRWDIAALGVAPGDEITYFAKAADNLPNRTQEGQSAPRTAVVVTVARKLAEMEQLKQIAQAGVNEASRYQEEARRSVAAIAGGAAQ